MDTGTSAIDYTTYPFRVSFLYADDHDLYTACYHTYMVPFLPSPPLPEVESYSAVNAAFFDSVIETDILEDTNTAEFWSEWRTPVKHFATL